MADKAFDALVNSLIVW